MSEWIERKWRSRREATMSSTSERTVSPERWALGRGGLCDTVFQAGCPRATLEPCMAPAPRKGCATNFPPSWMQPGQQKWPTAWPSTRGGGVATRATTTSYRWCYTRLRSCPGGPAGSQEPQFSYPHICPTKGQSWVQRACWSPVGVTSTGRRSSLSISCPVKHALIIS